MGRLGRSWHLAERALTVLAADKRLLLFPILSAVVSILILLGAGAIVFGTGIFSTHANAMQPHAKALFISDYIALFLCYLVLYFVIVFFNAALAASIIAYCREGKVSVSNGFAIAWRRIEFIFLWAVVSATIGVILQAFENRFRGLLRGVVVVLFGGAWIIVSYFVVPIIVAEGVGPFKAIKRSIQIIKKAWGESAILVVGLGILSSLGFVIVIIPIIVGIYTQNAQYLFISLGISIMLYALWALIISTLAMIICCVLYLYGAEGRIAPGFDENLLSSAFIVKRRFI